MHFSNKCFTKKNNYEIHFVIYFHSGFHPVIGTGPGGIGPGGDASIDPNALKSLVG